MSSISWTALTIQNHEFQLSIDALSLQGKKWLSIIGPSGAGKSTLLHSLFSNEKIKHGTVHIDSKDIKKLRQAEKRIGFVLQKPILFPNHTVKENLYLAHRGALSPQQILTEYFPSLSLTQSILKQKAQTLSGGEAARIQILQALIIPNLKLLLLDEAFASLDEPLKQELHFFIKLHAQRMDIPVISVTHSQEDAQQHSDKVCFICHGKSLEIAETQKLFTQPKKIETARFLSTGSIIPFEGRLYFVQRENISLSPLSGSHVKVPIQAQSVIKQNQQLIIKTDYGIIRLTGSQGFSGHIYAKKENFAFPLEQ